MGGSAGGAGLLVSCHATFGLLKQARESTGWAAAIWLVATGAAAGAGIWSTHFIAMLGYDPPLSVGYDVGLTLVSLGLPWRRLSPPHR